MRESNFHERVCELKEKYVGVSDFDFETIIKLEDEYSKLSETNPEHTKRRGDILRMRHELLRNLMCKPKENKKDMYIDIGRNKCIVCCDGKIFYIDTNGLKFSNIIEVISSRFGNFEDKSIFIDKRGIGMGLTDAFDDKGVQYTDIEILK
jgi:hypothetical protein